MKYWFIVIIGMLLFNTACCPKERHSSIVKYGMSVEEQDSILDDWIRRGHCIVVRGSDRNYDTIIDHVMFRFVTDSIYDTPIDSSKHKEYTE